LFNPDVKYSNGKLLLLTVLIGWLFCVYIPGSYSGDSWSQYNQMVSGTYDDWFGAAFSWTWRKLWRLTGNYSTLFVTHMALYSLFIFLLLEHIPMRSIMFWVLIVLAVFFSFIPQYVMRDSLMTLLWGIAVLLLLRTQQDRKDEQPQPRHRMMKATALFLLAYGLWVRTNTLVALLPLLWIIMPPINLLRIPKSVSNAPAIPKKPFIRWKAMLLSLLTCILFFLTAQFLTYRVLHATKSYPAFKLKLLDIAGISKLSGQNYFPESIRNYPDFNYDTLLKEYTPASFDAIIWPQSNRPTMIPYPTSALDSMANESWILAIKQHPLLYLQNRFSGFLYYLRIRKRFNDDAYWNVTMWIEPNNPLHLQHNYNSRQEQFLYYYLLLTNTFFFAPWFWLLLNSVAFVFFLYYSRRQATATSTARASWWLTHAWIQLSGVLFVLSQFPVYQHDRDFRYSYWSVFVAIIAISALYSVRRKGQNPGGSSSRSGSEVNSAMT
jgi:Ca2+/Na+ antiporter